MFENFNNLGFQNPYFININEKFIIKNSFSEIIEELPGNKNIDIIAVIELLNKNYILGDRTMVEGIRRSPWMSRPNKECNDWVKSEVPIHSNLEIDEKEIARELFDRISEEIVEYIGNKKNIGILLSGGMDSRIVAGVLDYLINTQRLNNLSICALTWGDINSRDVVYAKKIAKRLNWDWKHYIVNAENLLENISETSIRGAEYSPIHLHALPQIKKDIHLDCILAGSYGDSIGRGEYFGLKINDLKPIGDKFKNYGGILKDNLYKEFNNSWKVDIEEYHQKFPKSFNNGKLEQDYQLHYMRRMLNPCMEVIGDSTKFYQVFTKPDVFGYMWSINSKKRNNTIYKYMMELFCTNLRDIPWARTGVIYEDNEGFPDKYLKEHHSYRKIITTEITTEIKDNILSGELEQLGIFNMNILKKQMIDMGRYSNYSFRNLEILVWLVSLSKTIKKNDIQYENKNKIDNNLQDYYNEYVKFPTINYLGNFYKKK
jgi:hypothetical protein